MSTAHSAKTLDFSLETTSPVQGATGSRMRALNISSSCTIVVSLAGRGCVECGGRWRGVRLDGVGFGWVWWGVGLGEGVWGWVVVR